MAILARIRPCRHWSCWKPTAIPQPLLLLHTLATYEDENRQIKDGFRDIHSFFFTIIGFFLIPKNAKRFIEFSGGSGGLSTTLPSLLQCFEDLASSNMAAALIEHQLYRKNGLHVRIKHHNEVMLRYAPLLEGYKARHRAAQGIVQNQK